MDKKDEAVLLIKNEGKRKPSKLQGNQGREFYYNLMRKWVDGNDVLMYTIYNEGKYWEA